jgi:hypothetical protein
MAWWLACSTCQLHGMNLNPHAALEHAARCFARQRACACGDLSHTPRPQTSVWNSCPVCGVDLPQVCRVCVFACLCIHDSYRVQAACNNPVFRAPDGIGPLVESVPSSLAPLPPRVTSVTVVGGTLPCAGGQRMVRERVPPFGTCGWKRGGWDAAECLGVLCCAVLCCVVLCVLDITSPIVCPMRNLLAKPCQDTEPTTTPQSWASSPPTPTSHSVTTPCHCPVSPPCVATLCHHCVTTLCHRPVSLPSSPYCFTTLWHHPVSSPCVACLLRVWQEVFGVGLGSMGDLTVTVELQGPRGLTFLTPMCDVLEDMVHLKCVSPQGVGRVLSVVVVVGGVRSEPLATPALTYTTPIVLEITGPGSSDAPTMVCAVASFAPSPSPFTPHAHTQPYILTPCPSLGSVCVFLLVVATP